jgi:hypothetical protein
MAGAPPAVSWPLVDARDDGIRPGGRPDQCLYCRQRVGQYHGWQCVIVKKRVELRVRAAFTGGVVFGLWQLDLPHGWDAEAIEFYQNDSSWCASNFLREQELGTVTWEVGQDPWPALVGLHDAGDCLCSRLAFEFVRVVDDTPRRALQPEGRS